MTASGSSSGVPGLDPGGAADLELDVVEEDDRRLLPGLLGRHRHGLAVGVDELEPEGVASVGLVPGDVDEDRDPERCRLGAGQ